MATAKQKKDFLAKAKAHALQHGLPEPTSYEDLTINDQGEVVLDTPVEKPKPQSKTISYNYKLGREIDKSAKAGVLTAISEKAQLDALKADYKLPSIVYRVGTVTAVSTPKDGKMARIGVTILNPQGDEKSNIGISVGKGFIKAADIKVGETYDIGFEDRDLDSYYYTKENGNWVANSYTKPHLQMANMNVADAVGQGMAAKIQAKANAMEKAGRVEVGMATIEEVDKKVKELWTAAEKAIKNDDPLAASKLQASQAYHSSLVNSALSF